LKIKDMGPFFLLALLSGSVTVSAGRRLSRFPTRRHYLSPSAKPFSPTPDDPDPPKGAGIGSPILKWMGDSADIAS
jgi:hypothetical protein